MFGAVGGALGGRSGVVIVLVMAVDPRRTPVREQPMFDQPLQCTRPFDEA
jgi:hypothetical protein